MSSVQDEHSSEHSQAFQGLLNSYSPDDSAAEFPEGLPLRHSGHRSLGIGHTGNPSDHEHSVHRSQSVRPDAVDHWSILLNCTLLELRSELEHGSASLEPDIVLMFLVHHGGITAHIVQLFPFDMLNQVNTFRLRCSGIVVCCSGIVVSGAVLAHTTLSLRDFIVVPPLVQEGRRRSHIRRGNTLPLLVLLLTAPSSLILEKEKGNGTCLKKKHTSLRSFKRDKHVKKHKRKRSPSPS